MQVEGPDAATLFSGDRNVDYLDILIRLFLINLGILNPMDHVQALKCTTEDGMLLVQPWHLF